jgi:hypothetical protein
MLVFHPLSLSKIRALDSKLSELRQAPPERKAPGAGKAIGSLTRLLPQAYRAQSNRDYEPDEQGEQ